MQVHPVANIFPPMSDSEFESLKADIAEFGQREPIWTHDGMIIDGRHRFRACDELGLQPAARAYDGEDSGLVSFVVSLNLKRRHLDSSQRGMVAARLANMPPHRPSGNSANLQTSQSDAAQMLNVSTRTVAAAAKVNDDGAPELIAAVDSGAVSVSAAAQVATLPKEMQADIVATGPAEVAEVAKTIRQGPHVASNSGNNEWYTPPDYIEAARRVMGSIDVDPASSPVANERVRAATFYTASDNGLVQSWKGNVWMNPPYAQPLISDFSSVLVEKFHLGEIAQACVLVNNATETAWFRLMAEASFATCFTKGRVRFIDPEGNQGAPLQGQAVLYFGPNAQEFAAEFSRLGYVFVGKPVALAA
jgi:ParB family chromosome partitioning protein